MRRYPPLGRRAGRLLLIGAVCVSCSDDNLPTSPKSGALAVEPELRIKGRNLPEIAGSSTTSTFTAVWDTWWENISGGSTGLCTSNTTVWNKWDSCGLLNLQRWYIGKVARTYLALDFDTSPIPDDAIILDSPILRFRLIEAAEVDQTTEPPSLLCDFANPGGNSLDQNDTGVYFGQVDSAGAGGALVDSVVTDACTATVYEDRRPDRILRRADPIATIADLLPSWVSKTKITRLGIDLEDQIQNKVLLWQFFSADSAGYEPTLSVQWSRYDFYGAALGSPCWAGFDTLLVPDLNSSGTYERVDERLPIYLVWRHSEATGLQKLTPPMRIDSTSWWGAADFSYDDFAVSWTLDPTLDVEYHACPEGVSLDEVVLHDDGTLSVKDTNFGGIGSNVRIELRAMHSNPDSALVRVIVLQWGPPGTYVDAEGDSVDAAPDGSHAGIVTIADEVELGVAGRAISLRVPKRIVEWVSTDIAGVEPVRLVDEADLAALSAEMGHPVNWGFRGETRNYQVNVTMFGASALYIDGPDLAMMAADLDEDDCTGASKLAASGTASGSDKAAIFAWFGIAATNEMVPVGSGGELVPGYAIVDWEQNRRAIADPYGWRNQEP